MDEYPKIIYIKVQQEKGFNLFKRGLVPSNQRKEVNWENPTSETLMNQIHNNFLDFMCLDICCNAEGSPIMTLENRPEGPFQKIYQVEDVAASKAKFLKIKDDIVEVFSRDEDAFNQKGFNVTLYAVVIVKGGEYQGHIYSWLSPTDPDWFFAIGIRSRVDSVFVEDRLKRVSNYLLEGVRQLALAFKCKSMVITIPLPIMTKILSQNGFVQTNIKSQVIGNGLVPDNFHSQIYGNLCMLNSDITRCLL